MSSIGSTSSKLRLTGMATGMDTDSAIKQMMTAYYTRVDKVKQQQQVMQWKQEAYRDYAGQINSVKSKYFDVLSKDYILSNNSFSSFQVTQTGTTSNAVSAKALTGALEGNYKIEVTSTDIAKKATLDPTKSVNTKEATTGLAFPVVIKAVDGTNFNNKISIDGTEVTITSGTYSNLSQLAANINSNMDTSISDSYKAVVKDDSIKVFKKLTINDTNNTLKIDVDGATQNITIDNGSYTLEELSSKITGKLSGGYVAKSTDGLNISFTKADGAAVTGTAKYSNDTTIEFVSKAVIGRTGIDNNAFSNPTITNDTLSFDKRIIAGVNNTLIFNVFNGAGTSTVPTSITLDSGVYDMTSLITEINTKLGAGSTIKVEESVNGKVLFKSTTSDQITVTGNASGTLGVSSGFKIDQSTSDKMVNIINSNGSDRVNFTINGKKYLYDFTSTTNTTVGSDTYIGAKDKSISDILSDIQKGSNVDISYSQLDRKFYMTSRETGSSQNINITDDPTNKFVEKLFGTTTVTAGSDVVVKITQPNGSTNTVIQSTNSFTVDGVNYTLNSKPTNPVTFDVKGNIDNTFDKIKGFIDTYNDLIGSIAAKVEERKQYKILPLTDEQKEAMSEDQIKKWEGKAKEGILSGDSTLGNMLIQMRRAFFDEVQGAGANLFEIGLNTSSDYSQRGKIIIDETKLKDALKNDSDKVMNLFIQKSTTQSVYSRTMTRDVRDARYKEEGIFNRISDIIEDNISAFRDSNGKKGTLLEIAGVKGDFTEFKNYLTDQIKERESKINDMLQKIYTKEERYYKQFAQLEAAMNKMNSQSSWLASQLGGMSQG